MQYGIAVCGLLGLAVLAHAGPNLVANPGFETGDFTNWSFAAASCGSDFGVTTNPVDAHTGNFAAFFAGTCAGSYDSFEQTLATTPADSYDISFWIDTMSSGSDVRDLQVFWNGNLILDLPGPGTNTYQEYVFNDEAATGSTAVLEFRGYNPQTDFVDDVSVVDNAASVPETGTSLLLFVGLGLVLIRGLVPRRTRADSDTP